MTEREPVAPLIVIIRRSNDLPPETHVFHLQDELTACHITLGERQSFYPPRAPKNGHLTVLTINSRIRLTISNGKVSPARDVVPRPVALPVPPKPVVIPVPASPVSKQPTPPAVRTAIAR